MPGWAIRSCTCEMLHLLQNPVLLIGHPKRRCGPCTAVTALVSDGGWGSVDDTMWKRYSRDPEEYSPISRFHAGNLLDLTGRMKGQLNGSEM